MTKSIITKVPTHDGLLYVEMYSQWRVNFNRKMVIYK